MSSCGAKAGGPSLDGIDVSKSAIVQGIALLGGEPVSRGYVRLLDAQGDFTAEVPTSTEGQFRFFASPGEWSVRLLTAGATMEEKFSLRLGEPVDLVLEVGS